jgi:hypothetical protein
MISKRRLTIIPIFAPFASLLQSGARTSSDWQRAIETIGDALPEFSDHAPENNLHPTPEQLAFELRALSARVERIVQWLARVCPR